MGRELFPFERGRAHLWAVGLVPENRGNTPENRSRFSIIGQLTLSFFFCYSGDAMERGHFAKVTKMGRNGQKSRRHLRFLNAAEYLVRHLQRPALSTGCDIDIIDIIGPKLMPQSTIFHTLWLFNVAMENGPFIDVLPIKNGDFPLLC